ncbi:mannitol dehydrogenase family protein [Mesorhizobium sp. VNQ89]|uniref:mannitol dehydrogenase family protein n=1 Tax=Mesorhizobium quangtriensis TaxID=3157709 RepID=UPI0032B79377
MTDRLSNKTLGTLPSSVDVPRYDRTTVTPGLVHLGVGAFHRAHQAAYVDDCIAAGETSWGIIGASLQSASTYDALDPQDGLYTLAERGSGGERLRAIGSIQQMLVAPHHPAKLLDALTDPRVRIVTLTITEKAYLRNAAGGLDADHPGILADLAAPSHPQTAHGFLVEALARRRDAGTQPFTILSCDNLPSNGATLHRLLVQFAEIRDRELAKHVAGVACPSSMVDRIVPATTDADRQRVSAILGVEDAWPIMTEPFSQWVIEDNFPAGRPQWEKFGVEMVRDVGPFEEMKLRLLNGAHSSIAYLGLLAGHETVAKSFGDPRIRSFVQALWSEAKTTLPADAGLDTESYVTALTKRFDNTALAHRTAQIANDGSQKLPQRIIGSAIDRLETGNSAEHLMLTVAAWIRAAELRGTELPAGHFTDPLDSKLADVARTGGSAVETVEAIFDLAGLSDGSFHRPALEAMVAGHLDLLRIIGVEATLAQFEAGRTSH